MAPTVVYMILIFLSSSVPGRNLPGVVDDRIAHFLVYFGLGVTTMLSAAGFAPEGISLAHFLAALVVTLLFALSDEWHQSFVAGRDSSAKDLAFDMLGAGSAEALIWVLTGARR